MITGWSVNEGSAGSGAEQRPQQAAFSYGNASLDTYLKRQAKQDVKRRISRGYVATKPDSESDSVGYYTLRHSVGRPVRAAG